MNLLIKIKNKKQNKYIVSERLYIGNTDTINGFRSTYDNIYSVSGPKP